MSKAQLATVSRLTSQIAVMGQQSGALSNPSAILLGSVLDDFIANPEALLAVFHSPEALLQEFHATAQADSAKLNRKLAHAGRSLTVLVRAFSTDSLSPVRLFLTGSSQRSLNKEVTVGFLSHLRRLRAPGKRSAAGV